MIVTMADRFWKSMLAALRRPTLDEVYKGLRDLDYTQVDERLAVMLKASLQLEAQGECRKSATEAVLMVGYTSEGISNQEQASWLSWNVDGGMRGFDLARNLGLINRLITKNMVRENSHSPPGRQWDSQPNRRAGHCL